MAPKQESLFPEPNKARYGENRPHRPLFLPNYLIQESRSNLLKGKSLERAYEIIRRWADLESSGKLEKEHETGLEGEFLTLVLPKILVAKITKKQE